MESNFDLCAGSFYENEQALTKLRALFNRNLCRHCYKSLRKLARWIFCSALTLHCSVKNASCYGTNQPLLLCQHGYYQISCGERIKRSRTLGTSRFIRVICSTFVLGISRRSLPASALLVLCFPLDIGFSSTGGSDMSGNL